MPSVSSSRLAQIFSLVSLCIVSYGTVALPGQEAPSKSPANPPAESADAHASQNPNDQSKVTIANPYQVKVNLIVIPVVVRDSSGRAVGTLRPEDFEVFDNHKPQNITDFSIDKPPSSESASPPAAPSVSSKFVRPDRFTALFFDDLHSTFANLPQMQAASARLISSRLARNERLGIFSTSGKVALDFTDDRNRLQDAVKRLTPSPMPGSRPSSCPTLTHSQANEIVNRRSSAEIEAAVAEVMGACGVKKPEMAHGMVMSTAEEVLRAGNAQTAMLMKALSTLIDRLASRPGQRAIVLASPSFLVSDRDHTEYQLVDRAIRARVIINTLDTRGVYVDEERTVESDILGELANSTGGTYMRNTNDMSVGLHRLAAPPEFVYQLGISPPDLKEDGKYHHLQVRLANNRGFSVSAREGYFAPSKAVDPAQAAKTALNETVFSQNEIHNLPLELHTQFVRGDKPPVKLTVTALVDVRGLAHHEEGGQNVNRLELVAAVFDRNGKYMGALQGQHDVRWNGENPRPQTAATFSFILDSGAYFVRLVARDTESQQFYAENSLVEIPEK